MKIKVYLQRVRLNNGGYDSTGSYWGTGAPLYHFQADLPDTYSHTTWQWHTCDAELTAADVPACRNCGRSTKRDMNELNDHIRAYDRTHAKEIIQARQSTLDLQFTR